MIKCVTGKNAYATQELAEEALISAHTRLDFAKGQGPIATYKCDDCGYFHLTSKGSISPTLTHYLKAGKFEREKQANDWLNKLKHKRK